MDTKDRVLDLIDELWNKLEELPAGQGPGSLLPVWAERCLEHETEERDAVIAFLETARVPKAVIDLIARGVHRQRSTTAMRALKDSEHRIVAERKAAR